MLVTTEWLNEADLSDSTVLAESVARLLDGKKAKDVTIVDIRGKTIIADYFVIASATSTTAVRALVEYACEELEKRDINAAHKDIDPKKSVYQVVSGGNEFIRVGGKEINARAYLSKFNFAGADQEKLCGVLSGGERNRLHLALTLKAEANVLLLDEPTNDIDVNTLRALEEGLENFAGCAVVVSHDRWFLDRICTHILSFEGNSNVVFYEGSYSEYEEYKRKQSGYEEPKRVRYRKLIVD